MGLGPLNLSDADTSGFDPMPSATYAAEVFEVKKRTIADDTEGKLPPGTPGLAIQFKIVEGGEEGEYFNRRVFNNYWIPGSDFDENKGKKLKGMLVRFLVAIGYTEEEVMGGSFEIDPDDMEGRECAVVLGPPSKGFTSNQVNGVKPIGDHAATASGLL